jgi:hypothetical protein
LDCLKLAAKARKCRRIRREQGERDSVTRAGLRCAAAP